VAIPGFHFSAIGKALGHTVKIIMPDWLSKERMDIIKSLGAEVILISKKEGGFLGSIALSERMAKEDINIFFLNSLKIFIMQKHMKKLPQKRYGCNCNPSI
jgi:cysteine synthase